MSAGVLLALRRSLERALPPVTPLDRTTRRALAAVLAVAAALRVAWGVAGASSPVGDLTDPTLYRYLADQIAHGDGFTYAGEDPGPTAYYPPGYPYTLGILAAVLRPIPGTVSTFGIAVTLNIVLSVLTVAIVFELGRRLVDARVGLVAAGVLALWPNVVIHTGLVLTETLFLFLLSLMLLVALASPAVARAPGRARMVTTGLLFGAAGMVRPTSFVVAPLFLLLWWREGATVALRRTALVGAAVLTMVLPWTVRNTIRMDAPVLISTNLGDNVCIGNNPEANGGYMHPEACFAGLHRGDRPEAETDRQSQAFDRGWRHIRENPGEFLRMMPTKIRRTLDRDSDGLWSSTSFGEDARFSPTTFERLKTVGDGYYAVVGMLGLAGAVLLWLRADRAGRRRFLVLAAVVQLVPVMVTFGDPRFKMPLYPAIAVGVGVAVMTVARRRLPDDDVDIDSERPAGPGDRGGPGRPEAESGAEPPEPERTGAPA
jgi:Dolichyl-phosphate-mannose-protein mannosyltransferase